MEYSYHGTINRLREFYTSMRALNVGIGTFEHGYNGVNSDVIFDTRNSLEWKLIFIKRIDGIVLIIPIQRGYIFTIEGSLAYKQFREYFGIGAVKGEFSIKDFVRHLNCR